MLRTKELSDALELDENGQFVVPYAAGKYGILQAHIACLLYHKFRSGHVIRHCAFKSGSNLHTATLAWLSKDFFQHHGLQTPYQTAPDICIHLFGGKEQANQAYALALRNYEAGARETWFCDRYGHLTFYISGKVAKESVIMPDFPREIGY